MPVIEEDVTVTKRDVAETTNTPRRRDNLNRIDSFINTASAEEVTHIKKSLAYRSMALGIMPPPHKSKTVDRVFARLAVESVPILLTILFVVPLVCLGVLWVMYGRLFAFSRGCPKLCDQEILVMWGLVIAVGFMLIVLAYYSIRKLMIRARN